MAPVLNKFGLKGISTNDFGEALQALVGEKAKGLSANVVVRLKEQWAEEYDQWCRRDLSEKEYVYVWADGIHVKVRLEDDANKKQCILVLMGATADGTKELIAVLDGYRESERVTRRMMRGFDASQLVCEHSRVVTDRGVYVCPILIESPDANLGDTLTEASGPFALSHGACLTCYQYGAICSNASSAARGDK